ASWTFSRQRIVDLLASRSDNASRTWVAELTLFPGTMNLTPSAAVARTSPAGNRQGPPRGGHQEGRICGTATRHPSPPCRPVYPVYLLCPGPRQGLVLQVVGALSAGPTRGPLRPDPGQPPRRPAPPARVGAGHPVRPPPAAGPRLPGHPLQLDRGHGHPRRAEGLGRPAAPLRAHRRAGSAAQRPDRAAGTPGPAAAPPGLPRPAGPGLQRAARGRSRRADLPQGERPPLLQPSR